MPRKQEKRALSSKGLRLNLDAFDLQEALSGLVRACQSRDRKVACRHGVSVTQCHALSAVVARWAMTLNELASELYLDKSTASRVVDSLVGKGYLRRPRDREDVRALSIEPTGKGLALHSRIQRDLLRETSSLIAGDSPAARRAAIRLAARLAARLARLAAKELGRKEPPGA